MAAKVDNVAELDEAFLLCRFVRHSWDPVGLFRLGAVRTVSLLRCARCGTNRYDVYSSRGLLVDRYYERPDLYDVRGGAGSIDVRREILRRTPVLDAESGYRPRSKAGRRQRP